MKSAARTINWHPLPDPIREDEVNIEFTWSADERTTKAIVRQAKLMGFKMPSAYLLKALAATIAGNEEDTILTDDGRLLNGCDGYDGDGMPQNV